MQAKSTLKAPNYVSVASIGDNFVTIAWQGTGEFLVFRGLEKDFKPTQYNMVGQAFGNTFKDTALNMSTTYYYKVCAVDSYNNVCFGEKIEVKTTDKNISPPAPLSEIRVSVIDMHSLSLTFKTSQENDIESYEILRGEKVDLSDLAVIATVKAQPFYLQFYKDTELRVDTTYYYKVLAIDTAGNKATASPIATKKTPATDWWIV